MSQHGVRAVQIRAPNSIVAWVQRPASSGSDEAAELARRSAMSCSARRSAGSAANRRTIQRRTLVSTAPTGRPKAMDATARAEYGPIPGSRSSPSTVSGHS
jgi:hypothetical protein